MCQVAKVAATAQKAPTHCSTAVGVLRCHAPEYPQLYVTYVSTVTVASVSEFLA